MIDSSEQVLCSWTSIQWFYFRVITPQTLSAKDITKDLV